MLLRKRGGRSRQARPTANRPEPLYVFGAAGAPSDNRKTEPRGALGARRYATHQRSARYLRCRQGRLRPWGDGIDHPRDQGVAPFDSFGRYGLVRAYLLACGQIGESLPDNSPCPLYQLVNDLTGRLDLAEQANALAC